MALEPFSAKAVAEGKPTIFPPNTDRFGFPSSLSIPASTFAR
jgi:hypothetical protein